MTSIAIVTGASSGLGAEIVRQLAEDRRTAQQYARRQGEIHLE